MSVMDLVESIDVLLTEAKKLTGSVVEKLRPNDTVLVYHATISKHMQAFLNGVDTTQVMRRVYGGPKHPGLFVSPTFEGTHSFRGSGGVIEFETKARNLHGTDYSGRTRKEQEGRGFDFSFKDKEFPNSFRPYLSFTLSQSPEPQALHMGIIRPKDIKRVHYEGKWMTPDEYVAKHKLVGGLNLSDPKMSLDDYIKAGEFRDRKHAYDYLPIWLLDFKTEDELAHALTYYDDESPLPGGATLGRLAAKSVAREMWPLRRIGEEQHRQAVERMQAKGYA